MANSPPTSSLLETVGTRVLFNDVPGIIRFVGLTEFAAGTWVGIELDAPSGKNDGSVGTQRYFECSHEYGVFVRPVSIRLYDELKVPQIGKVSGTPTGVRGRKSSIVPPTILSPPRNTSRLASPSLLGGNMRSPASSRPSTSLGKFGSPVPSRSASRMSSSSNSVHIPRAATSAIMDVLHSSLNCTTDKSLIEPSENICTEKENQTIRVRRESAELTTTARVRSDITASHVQSKPSGNGSSHALNNADELETLKLKIRKLEGERAEDRLRLQTLASLTEAKAVWDTMRFKLQQKLIAQQEEIKKLHRTARELEIESAALSQKTLESEGSVEMATLDKEMAEEVAEHLKTEISELQDRLGAMEAKLQIRGAIPEPESGESTETSYPDKLIRENEKLREALIRLRDATMEQEKKSKAEQALAESRLQNLNVLKAKYEVTKAQILELENATEILKQQIEASSDSEGLIEVLTERNLVLNEKLEEVRAVVDDLEALRELSDQLEEDHVATERELHSEVDKREGVIRNANQRIELLEKMLLDYENRVQQFRVLVQSLQIDLADANNARAAYGQLAETLDTRSNALLLHNEQLRSIGAKAQAQYVDTELMRLESSESREQSEIQRWFLMPGLDANRSSLDCYLCLKRISARARLTCKTYYDQIRSDARSQPYLADSTMILKTIDLVFSLRRIAFISKKIESFAFHDVEVFQHLSTVVQDTQQVENTVTRLLHLAKQQEVNEADAQKSMQGTLAVLEHIAQSLVKSPSVPRETEAELFALSGNVEYSIEMALFLRKSGSESSQNEKDKERLEKTYDTMIDILQGCLSAATVFSSLHSFDGKNDALSTSQLASDAGKIAATVFEQLHQTFSNKIPPSPDSIAIDTAKIEQRAHEIIGLFAKMKLELDNRGAVMEQRTEPPWVTIATELKAQMGMDEKTERKLVQMSHEMQELVADIRSKERTIEEETMKSDLLAKRLEDAKKDMDRVANLEQQNVELEQNHKSDNETISKLTRESAQLKTSLNKWKATAESRQAAANGAWTSQAVDDAANTRVSYLTEELDGQYSTLRYLQGENYKLRVGTPCESDPWLLKPLLPVGSRKDEIRTYQRNAILKSLREFCAGSCVIDFRKVPLAHPGWVASAKSPGYKHYAQEELYARVLAEKHELIYGSSGRKFHKLESSVVKVIE